MKYNTEAVFEVIGDEPIVDQFDVLYSNLQSGSYVDNYVTGSMFTKVKQSDGSFKFTITETRGLAFSRLGIEANVTPGTISNSNDLNMAYNIQPWRERAGITRNVRIFSEIERIYDSFIPEINKIVSILGGSFLYFPSTDTVQIRLGKSAPGTAEVLNDFCESFPFEPKFSEVIRVPETPKNFVAKKGLSGMSFVPISPKFKTTTQVAFSAPSLRLWDTASSEEYSKLFFGFGDLKTIYPNLITGSIIPFENHVSNNLPTWRDGPASPKGAIIRGWKYGLYSGLPKYTSAVFRRNRYGQFRDMLEQREVTVSKADYSKSPSYYFGNVERQATPFANPITSKTENDQSINNMVVNVSFVKKGLSTTNKEIFSPIDPELTWTSNLSTAATSSLPYFDGEFRNRNEININLVSNTSLVSPGIDGGGNFQL